jgi:hypothetical protein
MKVDSNPALESPATNVDKEDAINRVKLALCTGYKFE